MPKVGEMSPKMQELMLSIMREGGGEEDEKAQVRTKPKGKKRPGKPVGKYKAVGKGIAKSADEILAASIKVKKDWTACSFIWVLERPFMDDQGIVRWEFLSACVGEHAKFITEFATPQCRKRRVTVYGTPLPEDNKTEEQLKKEEADGNNVEQKQQIQPELSFDEGSGS